MLYNNAVVHPNKVHAMELEDLVSCTMSALWSFHLKPSWYGLLFVIVTIRVETWSRRKQHHLLTFSRTEGAADDHFRWINNSISQSENIILVLFQVPHPEQNKHAIFYRDRSNQLFIKGLDCVYSLMPTTVALSLLSRLWGCNTWNKSIHELKINGMF